MRRLRLPSLAGLAGHVRAEVAAQADRWMLGAPIALGGGAATYFALKVEPSLWLLVGLALAAMALAAAVRRWVGHRGLLLLALYVALFAVGLAAAKVRAARVATPMAETTGAARIEGWVADVASSTSGAGRLVIAPVRIEGLTREQTPGRVRVTVPADGTAPPGTPIRLVAFLSAPPAPASPGAYDFARDAYFQGIGGVGFSRARPSVIALPEPPWRLRMEMAVNAARWRLAQKIAGHMGQGSAGLGAAMITGYQAWLGEDEQTSLRNSGLAHIISISGLHMAIVGGFAFLLVRLGVALVPWLALRIDGKKAAAVFGLVSVLAYLIVSGAPPPAQRSAITAAVAFGAILVDRRAISLHALAVAALVILILQPEAVVAPGFQMSFAATTALVALAEVWRRPVRAINTPWPIRLFQNGVTWLGVSLGASFVAGLATGPFAMQYFNRVAAYGLAANLVTEPLATFLIMPALALGALLQTVGLGAPFLALSGWGIDVLNAVSGWFASLPLAVWTVPSAPDVALPIAFLGMLFLCLWKGPLRWLGLPFAMAVTLWPRPEPPAVWVASDASAAAVHQGYDAVLVRPRVKLFAADLWARRRGFVLAAQGQGSVLFKCDRKQCRSIGEAGPPLALWWAKRRPSAAEFEGLCEGRSIVVVRSRPSGIPTACAGRLVLTGGDFARGGSAEIYHQGAGWRVVWAQDVRGIRPWSGPAPQ
jgi:competence protein ComEC